VFNTKAAVPLVRPAVYTYATKEVLGDPAGAIPIQSVGFPGNPEYVTVMVAPVA